MFNWTLGRQIVVAYFTMMGILMLYVIQTVYNTHGLMDSVGSLQNSNETLVSLEHLLITVTTEDANHRSYLRTNNAALLAGSETAAKTIDQEFDKLRTIFADSPEQTQRLEALRPLVTQELDLLRTSLETRRTQSPAAALDLLDAQGTPLLSAIRQKGIEMWRTSSELRSARDAQTTQASQRFIRYFAGGAVAILALSVAMALIVGTVLKRRLDSAISQVQGSSADLQAAATQQASGAREQASATTEISTTVKQLLSTSRQIAASTQQLASVAGETATAAGTGNATVQQAQEAIAAVRRQVDAIVNHMLDLGKRSQEVGGILDIINELAEQTNILAINATIESAGAGEHGKRFSVVAEEIRKLADRVGGATKDIRVLIDEIRAASNTTIMATEDGSKAVASSAQQFNDVAGNFRQIAELVRANLDVAREIEMSTQQQTTAVEQVNTAILEVAHTARQTETSSTQTLQTATQLISLSKQLSSIIDTGADSTRAAS